MVARGGGYGRAGYIDWNCAQMSEVLINRTGAVPLDPSKFRDPDWTAKGAARASIGLERLETLWFNTGTLCNIECANCYIESGPRNDRLAYLGAGEVLPYLDEIEALELGTREIGLTGGEPFMNPKILDIIGVALERGFEVLVLTNAMRPMQRARIKSGLIALNERFGAALTLRVSLDHYGRTLHEAERGPGSFKATLAGIDWLVENGFAINLAGRTCWGESEEEARAGYRRLAARRSWPVDADNRAELVLFPEMDEREDVPEITTECWSILGVDPRSMMCATSRMVVKCRDAEDPHVVPCTLLPYDPQFNMGRTLGQSLAVDGGAFKRGEVKLNHPHCARFCVLGGGSCSAEG